MPRGARKSRGHPKDLREVAGCRVLCALGYPALARAGHTRPSVCAEMYADMRVLTPRDTATYRQKTHSHTTKTHPFPGH